MAYDPRTQTGIPTERVGSLPRPSSLQAAYADYDAGKIARAQLEVEQERAVRDSLAHPEAADASIVSDGEQWWSSFATYSIADTPAGTGLAPNLAPGRQYFAIFSDGHYRQLPRLTGGPFRYKTYAADALARSIKFATKPMKQAVIAPSMLALLYPLKDELPGYSRAQFEQDLLNETEKDIRKAFDAGAAHVSIDFTEGRLADPRNPWTGAGIDPLDGRPPRRATTCPVQPTSFLGLNRPKQRISRTSGTRATELRVAPALPDIFVTPPASLKSSVLLAQTRF
jgi:methionine synthase II (cobalamin-independent)